MCVWPYLLDDLVRMDTHTREGAVLDDMQQERKVRPNTSLADFPEVRVGSVSPYGEFGRLVV